MRSGALNLRSWHPQLTVILNKIALLHQQEYRLGRHGGKGVCDLSIVAQQVSCLLVWSNGLWPEPQCDQNVLIKPLNAVRVCKMMNNLFPKFLKAIS